MNTQRFPSSTLDETAATHRASQQALDARRSTLDETLDTRRSTKRSTLDARRTAVREDRTVNKRLPDKSSRR
jgi:hypothetical protein